MPEVPRVDDVERPVAHDDGLLAGARTDSLAEPLEVFDLMAVLGLEC